MITPGSAKQEEITSIVNSKRGPNAEALEKAEDNQDFFNNYSQVDSMKSRIFHYLAMAIETIVFMGLFIYLFSVRTALESIMMPAAGLSVIFIILLTLHLFSLKKVKKTKA